MTPSETCAQMYKPHHQTCTESQSLLTDDRLSAPTADVTEAQQRPNLPSVAQKGTFF